MTHNHSFDALYRLAKQGDIKRAEKVWRAGLQRGKMKDIKTWGFMMKLYVDNGHHNRALELFQSISSSQSLKQNHITILTALRACCHLQNEDGLQMITEIHGQIQQNHIAETIVYSTLIEAYSKCGDLKAAESVFENVSTDLFTAKSMLTAYSEHNHHLDVISLFERMQNRADYGIIMDSVCYLIALNSCCKSESFERGKTIHRNLKEMQFECGIKIQTQLIDIYGKSGDLVTARNLFDAVIADERDDVLWTTLIRCYGFNGKVAESLALWKEWREHIDYGKTHCDQSVGYLVIIGVCSHCGAVDEAVRIFEDSKQSGNCNEKIYAAMMDGYARSGRLRDGLELLTEYEQIYGTASKAYGHLIMALFNGARTFNDLQIAENLYSKIKSTNFVDPTDDVLQTATTLMRQIYHQHRGSLHSDMQSVIDGICLKNYK